MYTKITHIKFKTLAKTNATSLNNFVKLKDIFKPGVRQPRTPDFLKLFLGGCLYVCVFVCVCVRARTY